MFRKDILKGLTMSSSPQKLVYTGSCNIRIKTIAQERTSISRKIKKTRMSNIFFRPSVGAKRSLEAL